VPQKKEYKGEITMSVIQQTYQGHEIKIEDDEKLTINAKEIDYMQDKALGKWFSKYLPYTQYDSLEALAKAIAVDTAEFKVFKEKRDG
jgi:hypothetical protein